MNYLTAIAALIGEITVIIAFLTPIFVKTRKLSNGIKCQLRHDMLRIYYEHEKTRVIRQYEYENFVFMYEAYKALKGNSFIDKIYKEVQSWEIVT